MKPKQEILIERKTNEFCKEVKSLNLTEENKRIYNAFVFRRSKPYKFEVVDKYDNTIRFVLCTNKLDDGVLHILLKHYQGAVGKVNAFEILNFCDVIRYEDMSTNDNSMTYTLKRNEQTYKLIIALKQSGTGTNVLKSFYSDRK